MQTKSHCPGNRAYQPFSIFIISIDDCLKRTFLFRIQKKFGFGLKVFLHVPVIIQMVLGQVGENACVKINTAGPVLIQGVGRDFHNNHLNSVFIHDRQHFVKFETVRGGHGCVQDFIRPAVVYSADNPGFKAAFLKYMLQ